MGGTVKKAGDAFGEAAKVAAPITHIVPNVRRTVKLAQSGDLKGALKNAIEINPLTGKIVTGALGLGGKGGGEAAAGGGGKVAKLPSLYGAANKYESLMDASRRQNLEAGQRLTANLEDQAYGRAPSLADAQLKSTQSRNLAQTLSAAQAAGASPLATRNLIQQRGQSGRDMAELGSIQKLQERQLAQQQLGQQLGNQANIVRGDIAQGFDIARSPVDMQQAQYSQQSSQDAAARLAAAQLQGQKDIEHKRGQQQMLGSVLGAAGTIGMAMSDEDEKQPVAPRKSKDSKKLTPEQKRKQALMKSMGGVDTIKDPSDAIKHMAELGAILLQQRQQAAAPQVPTFVNPGAMLPAAPSPFSPKAGAQAMNFSVGNDDDDGFYGSDENNKKPSQKNSKGMKAPDGDVDDFLSKLQPSKYEYKDTSKPGTSPGEHYGVMAQDLEKSSIGKTLVKNTPNGKMVDTVQGFGAVLAAQSELNKRLKALEGSKAKSSKGKA